jgi:hypothetical protein
MLAGTEGAAEPEVGSVWIMNILKPVMCRNLF